MTPAEFARLCEQHLKDKDSEITYLTRQLQDAQETIERLQKKRMQPVNFRVASLVKNGQSDSLWLEEVVKVIPLLHGYEIIIRGNR